MSLRRDGLGPVTLFPHPGFGAIPVCSIPEFPAGLEHRCDELAMVAIRQALEDAGIAPGSRELEDCALVLGNTTADLLGQEEKARPYLAQKTVDAPPTLGQGAMVGHLALRLADRVGIQGPVLAYSTACSASANALCQGMQLLRTGRVQRVLAVGVDSLTATSFYGFVALALLDPLGCRPFDRDRQGLQLGEGAAAVLIETDVVAGTVLLAAAGTFDAYHPTTSPPDGSADAAAMQLALQRAGVEANQLAGIKTHGTGSPNNDLAEANGMSRLFGESIPPFTSVKRYFGHTLGASGILELVAFVSCVQHGFVPANLGYASRDPHFDATPLTEHLDTTGGFFLLNSFGFGGGRVSLVVQTSASNETTG